LPIRDQIERVEKLNRFWRVVLGKERAKIKRFPISNGDSECHKKESLEVEQSLLIEIKHPAD